VKEKAAAKYCDFRNSEDFNLNQKALNFLYVFHYNKKLVKEIIFLVRLRFGSMTS